MRDQLRATQEDLGNAKDAIATLQTEQKHLQGLYATKIDELNAAMDAIRNLEVAGQEQQTLIDEYKRTVASLREDLEDVRAQYEEAGGKVTALIEQLTTQKDRYETLRTTCPIIPNGSTIVDGTDGTMFYVERGILRPLAPEVWRSMNSPEFTTFPGYQLRNCSRGPPMEAPTTTAAPETTTAAPTSMSVYALVHAGSWMDEDNFAWPRRDSTA